MSTFDIASEKIPPAGRDRPFPWQCFECRARDVYPKATDYTTTVKHDDHLYTVRVPDLEIPTCRQCGEQVFTASVDDRIISALRVQAGILTPQEMQGHRNELQLTQQELADQLGVSTESLSRWEAGGLIQSRAMDNLLRLFFGSEEVRRLLREGFVQQPASALAGTNVA